MINHLKEYRDYLAGKGDGMIDKDKIFLALLSPENDAEKEQNNKALWNTPAMKKYRTTNTHDTLRKQPDEMVLWGHFKMTKL